jgi:hypothetical protein
VGWHRLSFFIYVFKFHEAYKHKFADFWVLLLSIQRGEMSLSGYFSDGHRAAAACSPCGALEWQAATLRRLHFSMK